MLSSNTYNWWLFCFQDLQDVYSDPDDETAENNQEVKLKEKLSTINKQWWSMKKGDYTS